MAIVLQKDMRKADTVYGRVFSQGRYLGDFVCDLGFLPNSNFSGGVYSLLNSMYSDDAIDVLDTTGRTVATLTHRKSSSSKLCILVGSDGLTFRPCKSSFEAIKERFELGESVLVIREPLVMRA